MRVIDADALKSLFDERYDDAYMQSITRPNIAHWEGYACGVNWGRNTITDAPTVDAVEVVRCKNCKHTRKKAGHEKFMYNENVCICTKEDIWGINKSEPVWSDGFCSYGERKDNE